MDFVCTTCKCPLLYFVHLQQLTFACNIAVDNPYMKYYNMNILCALLNWHFYAPMKLTTFVYPIAIEDFLCTIVFKTFFMCNNNLQFSYALRQLTTIVCTIIYYYY